MTQDNDDIDIDLQPPADKLYAHNRRQLSAMLDGELSPDQARFMLRRLQHDAELAACWERWQVCGDVLRGRGHALLPADFSRRVAEAIAVPPAAEAARAAAGAGTAAPRRTAPHRLLRWSGGALAASFALVALFMARQLPEDAVPMQAGLSGSAGAAAQLQQSSASADASAASAGSAASSVASVAGGTALSSPENAGGTGDVSSGLLAVGAPLAVAVAEVPRRVAERGGSRGQSQRAALRRAQSASGQGPQRAVAAAPLPVGGAAAGQAFEAASVPQVPGSLHGLATLPAADAAQVGRLFDTLPATTPRPWPRAVLPGLPRAQPFAAGYGHVQGFPQAEAFAPFQPRLEPRPGAAAWRSGRAPVEADIEAAPADMP